MAVVTDAQITDVTKQLGPDEYKHCYIALELKKQDILKAECAGGLSTDEELKARRVLEKWRQQNGESATPALILEALKKCDNQEAVDALTRKWTTESIHYQERDAPEALAGEESTPDTSDEASGDFIQARTAMGHIYQTLLDLILQICMIFAGDGSFPMETGHEDMLSGKLIKGKGSLKELTDWKQEITDVISKLQNDHVTAIVFGCTSCGKSTLINAMLGGYFLPTSMGVCTSCIIHVQGHDGPDPFAVLPDGSRCPIKVFQERASALSDTHIAAGKSVILNLPKHKHKLLRSDFHFVDRPGISSSPEVDKIINEECDGADIYIFVVDAVTSITTEAREYFLGVARKLIMPNIIFVYNKWDESAWDDDDERTKSTQVRRQHIVDAKDLLQKGLEGGPEQDFETMRIFFVSAREMTLNKCSTDGWRERKKEFKRFLKALQIYAIKTKLGPHCNDGFQLCRQLEVWCDNTLKSLKREIEELMGKKTDLAEASERLRNSRSRFGGECEKKFEEIKDCMKNDVIKQRREMQHKLEATLKKLDYQEDKTDDFKKEVLDKVRENDKALQQSIDNVVTNQLRSIVQDLSTIANVTIHSNIDTGFQCKLRAPLADAVDKHFPKSDPPTLLDIRADFRRLIHQCQTDVNWTLAYLGIIMLVTLIIFRDWKVSLIATVVIITGVYFYVEKLEGERRSRKKALLKVVMDTCGNWLEVQEDAVLDESKDKSEKIAAATIDTCKEELERQMTENTKLTSAWMDRIKQQNKASESLQKQKEEHEKNVKLFVDFQLKFLESSDDDNVQHKH